ncbi:HpcH/HpaI aldolase family protein [Compostimonas suwonensis]|uniref:2-dehydro-3-deoxyglucarate aldolase/4-hydroxy-2-oxoheptanedioate aldolase n=1 Tax=Compostimonas suwonensis TaxID=1048394 RepID=A0A2M9BWU4_9MICO|nr:aldolase/citrate lyase family protein [Compostimonas suwonensis]PJJ62408.1 2-dehydro-3-deoxyglucarate aldolase/4-hydroxy-2-oxoheptanedioate aldolase [Compostimonas suwonensis]
MKRNRVKEIMDRGDLALMSHVTIADPAVVELIALAGFDGAFIDMEHSVFDVGLVAEMIRIADLSGITPVVRIPSVDPGLIQRLLDAGAQGIQIPHVDGVDGAKAAVQAVRYPPLGERGAHGGTRAAGYGTVPWDEHVRTSNSEILLIVMAEDTETIDQLEQIAAVDGIDLVAFGPADLGVALGLAGKPQELKAAFVDLVTRVRSVGKAKVYVPFNTAVLPFTPSELRDIGVSYSTVSPSPMLVLQRALKEAASRIRDELASGGAAGVPADRRG